MSENHNNHNNGNGNHPEEKLYEISERARNNPAFNPAAAAYVRQKAMEIRKNRKPFNVEEFKKFIESDPILSNMKNIHFDDD